MPYFLGNFAYPEIFLAALPKIAQSKARLEIFYLSQKSEEIMELSENFFSLNDYGMIKILLIQMWIYMNAYFIKQGVLFKEI